MKDNPYLVRKFLLCITLFLISVSTALAQLAVKNLTASNGTQIGFYQYTPADYTTKTKYPVIIFLHGIGERGNGTTELTKVKKIAIPKYIDRGHPMRFYWNGKWETFLVLMPQLSTSYGSWQAFYVEEMIKYAKANLSIDQNRIILTGLSLGGGGVWTFATSSLKNASELAAIAPVCGTCNMHNGASIIGAKLPVWAFHASNDHVVSVNCTHSAITKLNELKPVISPIKTIYSDGKHNIWDMAYDTTYKRQNPNIFEWFLGQNKSLPVNKLPVADAGPDDEIIINTSLQLNAGLSKDSDGKILRYSWKFLSGTATAKIDDASKSQTTVSGFTVTGEYRFELMVVDNRGSWHKDTLSIQVKNAVIPQPNKAPIANAGKNLTITLPVNEVTVDASGSSDEDGQITKYAWKKISGPAAVIEDPSSVSTRITGLTEGSYAFEVTVTDNKSATSSAQVSITVNATPNKAPIANAGKNINITLPKSEVIVDASASSDEDGQITKYAWKKISGSAAVIEDPSSVSTRITGLTEGSYAFEVTVTDNKSATSSAQVSITVNAAANKTPIADAGKNLTITLPVNEAILDASASSDEDGEITKYAWKKISGAAAVIEDPSAVNTRITGLTEGSYVFEVTVTDNKSATSSAQVSITVNATPNKAPIANAGKNINITLPISEVTVDASASSDEDGQITKYAWKKISGAAAVIEDPSAVNTRITGLTEGSYVFEVTVTDNKSATSSAQVSITVNAAPNKAPIANAGKNLTITLPVNESTLDASASSDEDGQVTKYAWKKISGSAAVIEDPSSVSTRITGLTEGSYVFEVSVTDNKSATSSAQVTITVNATPNKAPIADAGKNLTITLPVNEATLDASASSDEDGQITKYAWKKISGSAVLIEDPSSVSTRITGLTEGSYVFEVSVTDNKSATSSAQVSITVNAAPNKAPTANAGKNLTITLPINEVTVDANASSDEDGQITKYAWKKISGSAAVIEDPSSVSTRITGLTEGSYVFEVSVTDNKSATSSAQVSITVNAAPNKAPIANAGKNLTITLPIDEVTVDANASSDEDGQITKYAWKKISGSAAVIEDPSSVSTRITGLAEGSYVFEVTVTDNKSATSSAQVTITVNAAANKAPIANAGKNLTITLPIDEVTVDASASSDEDGQITKYAWKKISGSAAVIEDPSSVSTRITGLTEGSYVFEVSVTDNKSVTNSAQVTITVNAAPNKAPVANAGDDRIIYHPLDNIRLNGSRSYDSDGSIRKYTWRMLSHEGNYQIAWPTEASTPLRHLGVGIYIIELLVVDDRKGESRDTIHITVKPQEIINKAPVSLAGEDIIIYIPESQVLVDGSNSYDPDGELVSYTWTRISGPASFLLENSEMSSTKISSLLEGKYQFQLEVADSNGEKHRDTISIIVLPALNLAPKASAGKDHEIRLPINNIQLDGTASADQDGSISKYQWRKISGPASFKIISPASSKTTVNDLVEGTYTFRLTVTDNDGASDVDNITIIVSPALNIAPKANAGKDNEIRLPINNIQLDGTASADQDGSISKYQWTKISGPASFKIISPASSKTTVNELVEGTYTFRLTVTDNDGASDVDNITIIVSPALNIAPKANAGKDHEIRLPINNIQLDGTASADQDGSISKYQWTKISGPASFKIISPASSKTTVNELVEGTYTFRLTVTDNDGASDVDNITIIVSPALNIAPKANAGKDHEIRLPINNIQLDGTASADQDGSISKYQWTKISGPASFKIISPASSKTTLNELVEGTYTFRLTVTDNDGASDVDNITIIVSPALNIAPKANAGKDHEIRLPIKNIQLDGTASADQDGSISKYQWTKISGPASFKIISPASSKTTVNELVEGTYTFRLTVTDNDGASAADNITITVSRALNIAPKAKAGIDQEIKLPVSSVTLNGSASSDQDGKIMRYLWEKISGPALFNIAQPNNNKTSVTGLLAGTYVFQLTVTDDKGAISKDEMRVTVLPPMNQFPVANAGRDSSVSFPERSAILNGAASYDPDGIIIKYDWRQLSGPTTSIIIEQQQKTTQVDNLMPGEYIYQLSVTDNKNAVSYDTINIRVNNNLRFEESFTIAPNPAQSTVNLTLSGDDSGPVSVRIINLNGIHERSFMIQKIEPVMITVLDISYLKKGLYIIEITISATKKRSLHKLIKQ